MHGNMETGKKLSMLRERYALIGRQSHNDGNRLEKSIRAMGLSLTANEL